MNDAEKYYEGLHKAGSQYGAAVYDTDRMLKIGCIRKWFGGHSDTTLNLLDVGCGKGVFLKDLIEKIDHKWSVSCARAVGVDLIESADNVFAELDADFEFLRQNLDGERLQLEDKSFDFICCNHVLEHIFETENLLAEIYRVLRPGGLCVISVPNLAAWINRLLLLFAVQPLGTEVGVDSITYGFVTASARRHLQKFTPAGHIRDFTPRALKDITEASGLETAGWWNQDEIGLFRLTRWSGRSMGIVAVKSPDSLKRVG